MRRIKLTQGKYALVDDSDFSNLNKYKWSASKQPNTFYATRNLYSKGKQKTVRMHIEITDCPKGKEVDHIDSDGLNNQKSNLRICTRSQNMMNRRVNKNSVSGLKGVHWYKPYKKWIAKIKVDKECIHLGYFESKIEAYEVYCKACIKYHGEFSRIK